MRAQGIEIRDGNLPQGKGTFLWLLPRLVDYFGSVIALVDELKKSGYQWVCVKAQHGSLSGTGYNDNQAELLDEFVPLAEAAGIEVHGWGYCFGNTTLWRKANNQQQKEVNRIVEALIRWHFRSWMVDAEDEFKVSDGAKAATGLMTLLTQTLSTHTEDIDVPVGLSTYRYVSSHPEFPFAEFLQFCDFSGPQVYWQKSNYPVDQLEKSVSEWKAIKDLPFVVAGTLYPEGTWWPTGEHIRAFNARAKEMTEVIATNYWEHYYPYAYDKQDLIEALDEFVWEVEPEPPLPPQATITELAHLIKSMADKIIAQAEPAPIPEPTPEPVPEPTPEPEPSGVYVRLVEKEGYVNLVYARDANNQNVPIWTIWPRDNAEVKDRCQVQPATLVPIVKGGRKQGDGGAWAYEVDRERPIVLRSGAAVPGYNQVADNQLSAVKEKAPYFIGRLYVLEKHVAERIEEGM